ncbi:MAG: hypothetical protein HZC55_16210 [Verrucomicrobia bacterium]|nr:hypothetical protein [Verrucomicrobiota bacterium]
MQLFARFSSFSLLAVLAAAWTGAGETAPAARLPRKSPFEAVGNAAAPAAAASETIEFSGVTTVGRQTDLIFHDKTKKKSVWVGIGETKEGITVVSYDQQRAQAVVKINGAEKVMALRKGAAPAGGANTAPALTPFLPGQAPATPLVITPNPPPVAPAAAPTAPTETAPSTPAPVGAAPASPAEVQRRQETEARMLVSDLLEIGMAQRKAYEEAQRRAAETPTPAPTTAEPPKP